MTTRFTIGISLLILCAATFASEMPIKAQLCSGCHGKSGVSTDPRWPNLAGQNQQYLIDQIKAFRSGHRLDALMSPTAKELSDEDIVQLAAYYSSQPLAVAGNNNSDLIRKGQHLASYCILCHGTRGELAPDQWPKLVGQHAAYTKNQLSAFKNKTRHSPIMEYHLRNLDDSDFDALAAYFSQAQP